MSKNSSKSGRNSLDVKVNEDGSISFDLKKLLAMSRSELERDIGTDSVDYEAGRAEGRADVAVELRKRVDPEDIHHLNIDGTLAKVRYYRDFIQELADEDCDYGDECPAFASTRHGTCLRCRAKKVLEG